MDGKRVRTVAAGIGFTEGPLWTERGELLVVSMSRGLVYSIDPAGTGVVATWETGGGPNGLAEGPGGVIYVAQNGGATMTSPSSRPVRPGIQALADASVADLLVEGCDAPNDLVVGPDGLVWFTDPKPAASGRVCTFDPTDGSMKVAIEDVVFPNGLAFGTDPNELYIADSERHEIVRYDVSGVRPMRLGVWASLAGGSPDGIAFDADGRLYVAAFKHDEVLVFAPDGTLEQSISTGEGSRPTNCCFGGDDLSTLFVTVAKGGRVLALDGFSGRPPSPWARDA